MELLTDKVIYHVETQEDYDDLMERLEKLGCMFLLGSNPTHEEYWLSYDSETCVRVSKNIVSYATKEFYESEYPEIEIIKYKKEQNLMKVKMKSKKILHRLGLLLKR